MWMAGLEDLCSAAPRNEVPVVFHVAHYLKYLLTRQAVGELDIFLLELSLVMYIEILEEAVGTWSGVKRTTRRSVCVDCKSTKCQNACICQTLCLGVCKHAHVNTHTQDTNGMIWSLTDRPAAHMNAPLPKNQAGRPGKSSAHAICMRQRGIALRTTLQARRQPLVPS